MVRILLADDHKILRDGLHSMLDAQQGFEVVAVADTGRKAVRLVDKHKPDVVIMDINMPELNGIDATRQIKANRPETKVITLSMYSDRHFIEGMLKAGVSGYLIKECAFEDMVTAVRMVMKDKVFLSTEITRAVIGEYVEILRNGSQSRGEELTNREREILQLIAEGHSTKMIAEKLFISTKTVETHRRNIMDKLEIHTIPELTKYALRIGLTSL